MRFYIFLIWTTFYDFNIYDQVVTGFQNIYWNISNYKYLFYFVLSLNFPLCKIILVSRLDTCFKLNSNCLNFLIVLEKTPTILSAAFFPFIFASSIYSKFLTLHIFLFFYRIDIFLYFSLKYKYYIFYI